MKQKERSFSWTRTLYLLVVLVLVSLALILLSQGRYLQPIEGIASQVFTPIQRAVHDATSTVGSWLGSFTRGQELDEENKRLRTMVESLTTENARLETLERENASLRQLLKFQTDRPEMKGVVASNIGGDPSGLMEIITIDRGSSQGLAPGMAVVSPGGILVGEISSVKPDRSTVLLVTDASSSIGVITQRTQTPGVMEGQWQKGGRLLVRHLGRDADVQQGDYLLTSGVGGSFPKGLIAGQIETIRQGDVQMEKEAEAYPLTELKSLETVLVITSGGQK